MKTENNAQYTNKAQRANLHKWTGAQASTSGDNLPLAQVRGIVIQSHSLSKEWPFARRFLT